MYDIEYTQRAIDDLRQFKKHEQKEIVEAIANQLSFQPTVETRNRKRMRPNSVAGWELRVGDFRVLYDADELIRIVEVQRIGEKRGNRFFFDGQEETLG